MRISAAVLSPEVGTHLILLTILQAELEQLKQEAETAGAAAARQAAAASAAQNEVLQKELAEARAAVVEKEQELEAVQGILSSADKSRADETLRAQMECHRCVVRQSDQSCQVLVPWIIRPWHAMSCIGSSCKEFSGQTSGPVGIAATPQHTVLTVDSKC